MVRLQKLKKQPPAFQISLMEDGWSGSGQPLAALNIGFELEEISLLLSRERVAFRQPV